MIRTPGYFAIPNVAAEYTWFSFRAMDFLITKNDLTYYDYYAQAAAEFAVDEPSLPAPAVLSAIVRISANDFHLTSSPPSSPFFPCVNLTCFGEEPDNFVLATDYRRVIDNLAYVMNDYRIAPAVHNPGSIKFYHKQVDQTHITHPSGEEGMSLLELTAKQIDHTISGWSVPSNAARTALARMLDAENDNLLPAYHINGDLVHPNDYTMTLKGAVVAVDFILRRRVLPDNRHRFAAQVRRIDVLETPHPPAAEVVHVLD
jgi:hypothetical protein